MCVGKTFHWKTLQNNPTQVCLNFKFEKLARKFSDANLHNPILNNFAEKSEAFSNMFTFKLWKFERQILKDLRYKLKKKNYINMYNFQHCILMWQF